MEESYWFYTLKSEKANQSDLETVNSIAASSTIDKMWPIGSIYISTTDDTVEKVQVRFGGTWESYGSGRTLVGVDTSQSEFNSVEKTGGEKTHNLTVNEMPSHQHWTSLGIGVLNTPGNSNLQPGLRTTDLEVKSSACGVAQT